jgi:hypothetical protein
MHTDYKALDMSDMPNNPSEQPESWTEFADYKTNTLYKITDNRVFDTVSPIPWVILDPWLRRSIESGEIVSITVEKKRVV